MKETYRCATIQDDISFVILVLYPLKRCTEVVFHVLHMRDIYIIYIEVVIVLYVQKVEFSGIFWDDGRKTIYLV
jgi:hypothetical protein